ncbi:MAG TPA: DUF4062 domain-containing protein, partial [Gemmataceae bacterium]|nr:DUF4062 domain-containing protein [Gemmataceae bacterium]
MPNTWKTVRIFISSTFRDMHAERDHLIKVVFPALREKLEPHRVHLIDIDLRWGVTKEQAENDLVLDLCLKQIDECRPFFIGILGERYGWVPQTYPVDAIRKFGWIQHYTGKSVTELEIIHGVIQDPQMRGHAFFYFRDPKATDGIPEPIQSEVYVETDPARKAKLAELKQTIRASGYPVMENYAARWNPEAFESTTKSKGRLSGLGEFGERLRQQLWEGIQAELERERQQAAAGGGGAGVGLGGTTAASPGDAASSPDSQAEEADMHERFMESRLRVYVGREAIQNELMQFANGSGEVPCLLTGPSGSGKSAVLARFVTTFRQQHQAVFVVPHFVGASPRSTGLRDMLRRLCLNLKQRFTLPDEVPEEAARLIVTFREMLSKVPANERTLLVIDALNQLDETDRAQHLEWLPAKSPAQVKIVVSCISDSGKTEPALEAFRHRQHVRIEVKPLDDVERRGIIHEVPSLSAKTLDDLQIGLLLSNPSTDNPLFLLVALEELRGFGSYEQLDEKIVHFPRPGESVPLWKTWLAQVQKEAHSREIQARSRSDEAEAKKWRDQIARLIRLGPMLEAITPVADTVTAIFTQVIDRLEDEFSRDTAFSIVTLLGSARRGLSERELLDLLEGNGVKIEDSKSDLFPILRQLRPYLMSRGGLLDFYHRNLYKAV